MKRLPSSLAPSSIPALLLLLPLALPAQVTTVDEGSFTIARRGTRVGQETFTIRKSASPGGGDVYVASANISTDAQRLSPALRADAAFVPLAYQLEVRNGDDVSERLKGLIGRGRFSAQLRTPTGESAKEYIVSDGALILDDGVFHQYYFLAQKMAQTAATSSTVPVVIPRRNVQVIMRVQMAGRDRVTIGGTPIDARRIVLTEPGGAVRQVWVDDRGRVLKVSLDAQGLIATRDEPPR